MAAVELQSLESIVRNLHLAALAMCFFLVISADLTAATSAFKRLNSVAFKRLHTIHTTLSLGLIVLWATGLFLIWRGTAFDVSQFSPKLIAKILVVTLLTANAFVIGRLAMPFMERNADKLFGENSLALRLRLAWCGAISSASWISAFCLGAIPWLKTASAAELTTFLWPIYGFCFAAACFFALLSGRKQAEIALPDPSPLVLGTSRRLSQSNVFPAE